MDPAALLQALSFAALKHRDQRRKDAEASPYINHPIAVAAVLAAEGGVVDAPLLIAAVLHDTVEDIETTFEELTEHFGGAVADLVREVTDDKTLAKEERKRRQIEHAQASSIGAKQIKIADKVCNLRDIAAHPPVKWPLQRRRDYLTWAEQVVQGCRGANPRLDAVFDVALIHAQQRVVGDA